MTKFYIISVLVLIIFSCDTDLPEKQINKWKEEIMTVEADFSDLASREGIHKAFITYAADSAVLMRNNELLKGRIKIDEFYMNQNSTGLSWAPSFVDVSSSGDLGYTYGEYIFSSIDSSGQIKENKGIFHTVWKRQEDGRWKFVWD